MTERWLPVVGYENSYEVSDLGQVRSLQRVIVRCNGVCQNVQQKILKPVVHNGRYFQVSLYKDGSANVLSVHRLVLEAFVGPCPPRMECLHWDDDGENNKLSNLRWGSRKENEEDKFRNGRKAGTEKTHCINGHEFTPENTYSHGIKGRKCRSCTISRAKSRNRKMRKKTPANHIME